MFNRTHRCVGRFSFVSLALGLLLPVASFTGCASWYPTHDDAAVEEPDDNIFSSMRSPTSEGEMMGLDPRAREVEHSLGYR